MSKIRVLPEVLANKIAAGEIVERPASVVKELLENSIDAGGLSIRVAVELGGKKLISVSDDGEGMTQDDAILAFEHHATSKISTAEDLAAISTLGFRGEALPSIASISRLTLRTRPKGRGAEAGTELEIQGGTLRSVKPVAWDAGTEITVRDLFFNVPARRKFLRSNDTELGHITRLVTQYAIAYAEARFKLESEARVLMDCAPVDSLRDRLYQIFGDAFLENLVDVSAERDGIRVHGLCSQPHEQRTNAYSQFFFVNRRMVRDKVIASAVRQAYRNTMPSTAYPVLVLFVEMACDQVDVNAHPAKIEVRFRQQALVHDLVRDSLRLALTRIPSIPVYEHRLPPPAEALPPVPGPAAEPYRITSGTDSSSPLQRAFHYPFREVVPPPLSPLGDHGLLRMRPDMLLGAPLDERAPFRAEGVRILGQLHDSYIIGADREGLLIIDQHVAHERILYERFAAALESGKVEVQGLLVPISVELSPQRTAVFSRVMPELQRNGFQVEPFGGHSVMVRGVPAIAGEEDIRALLEELLDGLEVEDRTVDVLRIRDRIAVSMACRAAVKVHMPLSAEKMQWLLDELARTRVPTNCPHGRPILLRFSLYEIERNFGRA